MVHASAISVLMVLLFFAAMKLLSPLAYFIEKHQSEFAPVIEWDPAKERIMPLDLTTGNKDLTQEVMEDTTAFTLYITSLLQQRKCRFAVGGYDELRTMYARSPLFGESQEEPRRLHLGMDIWGEAGTEVYAFMEGKVHSFAFNDRMGDYGATLILSHQLEGVIFCTLYGHIRLADISSIAIGQTINRGQLLAHFGDIRENGHWPPHLHFQLIADMEGMNGDYPGVCKASEREKYLLNCPDPDLILQLNRFL
jgi:hypothetical protein